MKELSDAELSALVRLLDEEDTMILNQVENELLAQGTKVIPFLEEAWGNNFDPNIQSRIEELVHTLQFDLLKDKLKSWSEEENNDLLEGLWLIATYQFPDLEKAQLVEELQQIYYQVWLEFKPEVVPLDQVKLINGVLFNKLRFSANTKNFHAPSNSMINQVLQSKRGNPITLCVIYMMIAQQLELPVYGVNLPNLFILTYKTEETQFYINVFNKGLIFSREDIDNYIANLRLTPREIFFQPCTNNDIVVRMFRNLIVAFDKIDEHQKSEEMKELLLMIRPDSYDY